VVTLADLPVRRVIGWAPAAHMRTDLTKNAITMAFANRATEEGVAIGSDRAWKYESRQFAGPARSNGVMLSVGRKGDCLGNTVTERLFAVISRESGQLGHDQQGQDSVGMSSSTSLVAATSAACTRRSAISDRPLTTRPTTPTVRRHMVN